jgi:nicotinate-nucleotide adenylyltransferase
MRLGIFGGTFDPIHEGHIGVARLARDRFGLDRVLLVPNRLPPHKEQETGAGYEERMAMARLAVEGEPGMMVSELENRVGKSYTIQTLEQLRREIDGDVTFFFIIGADAFAEVDSWYRAADVMRMTEFIVVSRPGFVYAVPKGARVHALENVAYAVSSTQLRKALEAGVAAKDLPGLVPRVGQYIEERRMYRKTGEKF